MIMKKWCHGMKGRLPAGLFISLCLLLMPLWPLMAQSSGEITITGIVRDRLDKPVEAVTVRVSNNPSALAITDGSGRYTVKANKQSALEFSHVSFKTQVLQVGSSLEINVTLEAAEGNVNEVVVVGFGRQKKISLVGAQSSVNVEELKQPVASITNVLAGRIAGVVGVQRSGEPGRDFSEIWIRGISTFTGTNSAAPLILVDGVERSLNSIDPEDIASFSILKDAAATAVYGVRGANGVVLVKTKGGKAGKTAFVVNYNQGLTTFTQIPEMANGLTYMKLANEALANSGQSPRFSQAYIDNTAKGDDPIVYPNVDWIRALFNDRGNNRRVNVSATGGTDKANYYVSLAYYDEKGLLKTDGLEKYNADTRFKKFNFTSNTNLTLTKTTKFELGIQGYITNANYPAVSSSTAFQSAMALSPVIFPIMYPGNKVPGINASGPDGADRNPYADITRRGFQTVFGNQVYTNARVNQDLGFWVPGLTFTSMFSFDTYNSQTITRGKREDTWFVNQNQPYNPDGSLNLFKTWTGENTLGYSRSNGGDRRFYTETALNYAKDFGQHSVSGMLLYNQSDFLNAFAGDLIASIPYRFRGIAGRGTYSYKGRYFGELNFGYNGSENFAPSERYGFFPSYGIGWVVSEEPFFEGAGRFIQFLKLRFSDGTVGSGSGGRRFGYQTFVNGSAAGYTFGGPTARVGYNGVAISEYGVDVTWSTARKSDLGIEFKTLNNNLSVVVDLFKERRTGVFLQRGTLSDMVGVISNPYANLGVIENKGIDMTVESLPLKIGATTWNLRGNLTFNRDKVIENDQPDAVHPWMNRRGTNLNATYGLIALGLFTDEHEIETSADQSALGGRPRPGDIRYKDLNGDGVINSYDEAQIGRGTIPAVTYGFGLNMNWKGFSIGAFFQGAGQVDRYISGDGIIPFANGAAADRSNLFAIAEDRWSVDNPNPNAFYPRLGWGAANNNNNRASSWWVKDVSYLRLKTAELTYTLPASLLERFSVKNTRIYLQGYNLLTFSKFKLWDPELGTSNGAMYPNVTTVSAGIQMNL